MVIEVACALRGKRASGDEGTSGMQREHHGGTIRITWHAPGTQGQIRSFYARIKGQADTFDYRIKCTKAECNEMVDFAGEILRDILARGIVDDEIQLDLISNQNQKMMNEEMIKFIEACDWGASDRPAGYPECECGE